MLFRLITGVLGAAVVLFAFTWPDVMPALEVNLPIQFIGYLTAFVVVLGVYLMFYGITGEWLPRLTKLRDRT